VALAHHQTLKLGVVVFVICSGLGIVSVAFASHQAPTLRLGVGIFATCSGFGHCVLGALRPKRLIMSTPNWEFNQVMRAALVSC